MTHPEAAWAEQLHTLHAQAWHRLMRGVHDRHAAARHPTLATVSADGLPQLRTVVLRQADPTAATLQIHTNAHSPKVNELLAKPVAALHVWDARARLQMRLQASASLASGEAVATLWAQVPAGSRAAYSSTARPGEPLQDALAYVQTPDPETFTVITLRIDRMDILHLGERHRRAVFSRYDAWVGQWVVP